jgi:hypothetical protein
MKPKIPACPSVADAASRLRLAFFALPAHWTRKLSIGYYITPVFVRGTSGVLSSSRIVGVDNGKLGG